MGVGVHGLECEAIARGRRLTEGFTGQSACPRSPHCVDRWFGGGSCSSTLKICTTLFYRLFLSGLIFCIVRNLCLSPPPNFHSDRLLARHVERSDTLKPEAARLLREALVRGRIDRGEASRITGLPERTARRVLGDIVDAGLLASATPKGPVSLRFPVDALEGLFPRLCPDA